MAKLANYTTEQTAELVTAYNEMATESDRMNVVEAFMARFNKTKRSIVGKLSSEKVYIKAEVEATEGRTSKADMVGSIAKLSGETEEQLESLERATKNALKRVIAALERKDATIAELLS